jgi:hypothetical protein
MKFGSACYPSRVAAYSRARRHVVSGHSGRASRRARYRAHAADGGVPPPGRAATARGEDWRRCLRRARRRDSEYSCECLSVHSSHCLAPLEEGAMDSADPLAAAVKFEDESHSRQPVLHSRTVAIVINNLSSLSKSLSQIS